MFKTIIRFAHGKLVFGRRKQTLVQSLSEFLDGNHQIVDVGTGDGSIARLIQERLGDVEVIGMDVLVRPKTAIDVRVFDGKKLPVGDDTCDAVTFVDVLHHTQDPEVLLAEAHRISRKCIVIKDHIAETKFDRAVLRFMDWVGNAPHDVALTYNYVSRKTWDKRFQNAGLRVERFTNDIPLYPWPFSLLFGRSLHFVARLSLTGEKSDGVRSGN